MTRSKSSSRKRQLAYYEFLKFSGNSLSFFQDSFYKSLYEKKSEEKKKRHLINSESYMELDASGQPSGTIKLTYGLSILFSEMNHNFISNFQPFRIPTNHKLISHHEYNKSSISISQPCISKTHPHLIIKNISTLPNHECSKAVTNDKKKWNLIPIDLQNSKVVRSWKPILEQYAMYHCTKLIPLEVDSSMQRNQINLMVDSDTRIVKDFLRS